MMFRLDGKTAAVVGAASGIGRAIAAGFGGQGAVVQCLDIDGSGAERTAARIVAAGGVARAGTVDVRSSASVDEAIAGIVDGWGRLDVAVATPGINIHKPMLRYTDEDYEHVVDVNLRGTFNVLRAAGRLMVRQRAGSMIVMSSISCREVEPGQVVYAGTKAAVAQMVRVLAAETGPYGVRVNALSPGPVETELTEPIRADAAWRDAYASRTGLQRWAAAEELAPPAIFLASDEASYVNGTVLFVDGGWTDMDRRFQGGDVLEGDLALP